MQSSMSLIFGMILLGLGSVQPHCREPQEIRTCETLCQEGKCELRAAVILSKSNATKASLSTVMPVLDLAEEEILKRNLLPPNTTIRWFTYDDQCDASYGLISAIDAYANDCVHVFFGPICEFALASIARIVKFLGNTGTPLLTVGGLSFDFVSDKTDCSHEYYMLTRAGSVGFRDIAYFIIDLMYQYSWKKILLVNEPTGQYSIAGKNTCHLMMKTMAQFIKADNLMYTSWDTTQNKLQNFSDNLRNEMAMSYSSTNGVAFWWCMRGMRDMKWLVSTLVIWPSKPWRRCSWRTLAWSTPRGSSRQTTPA